MGNDREMVRNCAERGLRFICEAREGQRLTDAQCDVIAFVLGLATGQSERIATLEERVRELETTLKLVGGVTV